jgi:hypothetical protein
MADTFIKDPSDVLDYTFDWTSFLATGETISSYTVTPDTGLTKDSDSQASGVITYWLSGGTADSLYNVVCKIVTSAGRTVERTATFKVKNL